MAKRIGDSFVIVLNEDNRIISCDIIGKPTEEDIDKLYASNHGIVLDGTKFQIKIWEEIMRIPRGETRTYTEIAEAIGNKNSYRAVANACGQNKIAVLIPCHRVVGKNNLGGYKWGISTKKLLLSLKK